MNHSVQKKENAFLKKFSRTDLLLLAVCLLFYLLFPIFDGPVWCKDSLSYAGKDISREPLYPMFLALMKVLDGAEISASGMMAAVIVQSLIAGFATWYAGYVVKKTKNESRVLQFATIGFQFAVSLLCRFAAIRSSVYIDCIMTEGVCLSLFVLFTVELYLCVITEKKRHIAAAMILSFLLFSLRKQMLITIIIMGAVFGWYYIIRSRKIRKFCALVLLMLLALLSGKLLDRTYNYVVRGAWIEHCHNSMGFLCVLLYTSDVENDQKLFEDETLKKLYLDIMEQAEEEQILYDDAEPGWLPLAVHFADSYDAIGYGIINPVVEGYIGENFSYSEVEAALKYDEICGGMVSVLLRQQKGPLMQVWAYNIWRGFVNSIARATNLLSLYSLAAYLFVGAMAWYLIAQKKKLQNMMQQRPGMAEYENSIEQIERSLTFMFIVLIAIAVNSLAVGLTIFTQPRYMLYSMGLFYAAGSMMLYDILRIELIKRRKPL
ncbi:MAG: hypothetical protein K2P23_04400 [Lachnospiraceae bacterium]|nr:hypothetical protein [Lachnospiraceae bacterium]